MKQLFWRYLLISRYRFWLYLAGTYVVGFSFGSDRLSLFLDWHFLLFLIYFLLPANLLLYGINDYHDYDTDQHNHKKGTKELLLENSQRHQLKIALMGLALISVGLFFIGTYLEFFLSLLFLFLAWAYSSPPFRFKAKPVIDFLANFLYVLPGIIGFHQASGHLPPWDIMIAAGLWTSAMHLFSAIPDISSDRKAHLKTTAVVLGPRRSLVLCFGLWLGSILLVTMHQGRIFWFILGLPYLLIPLFLEAGRYERVGQVYWLFPYLNGTIGFLLFLISRILA
jgi:4-hydroxybenzoate polyprenyltransferase